MEKTLKKKKRRRKIQDLSLRTAFVIYVAVAAILATLVCSIIINAADNASYHIYIHYRDSAAVYEIPPRGYYDVVYGETEATYTIYDEDGNPGQSFTFGFGSPPPMLDTSDSGGVSSLLVLADYSPKDRSLMVVFSVIGAAAIPVCYITAIILCAIFFYRRKLKQPIAILDAASEKIARNELDFSITYDSRDEMGRLCDSFEKMRGALDENNRHTWRQMEERKRLNAAFSHDLRTPLTVLKGHMDMLYSSAVSGELPSDTTVDEIKSMRTHISRLENYVDVMAKLQRLEDLQVTRSPTNREAFLAALKDSAEILTGGKTLLFSATGGGETINIDSEIVMQVYENLLSNALRYAKSAIEITVAVEETSLTILVADDGPGFSPKDLEKATAPFYKSKSGSNDGHLGLGLNICETLCKHHGGSVSLMNSPTGGRVVAVFGTV